MFYSKNSQKLWISVYKNQHECWNIVFFAEEASCEYLQQYTDEAMVNLQESGVYPYGQEQSTDDDEDLPTQSDENPPYDPEMRTSLDDEQTFDNEGYCSDDFRFLPEDHF